MRRTSEAPFPHGWKRVAYFVIEDGKPRQVDHYKAVLRDVTIAAARGDAVLYAVWPGQYRSDLFEVDDLPKLGEALGVSLPYPAEGTAQ